MTGLHCGCSALQKWLPDALGCMASTPAHHESLVRCTCASLQRGQRVTGGTRPWTSRSALCHQQCSWHLLAAALSLPWIAACPREPAARLWLPVLFSPLCSCVIRLGGSKKCASELVVQIWKATDVLLQISYCLVPESVMYVGLLQWVFLLLLIFSIVTMWYITFSSNTVIEHANTMYFYEYEPVYKQPYLFTSREHLKCKDTNPFLVILVSSRPNDVESRQAIRITWGSHSFWWGHRILTLFLLGQETEREDKSAALSVEDESILYGDIISQDFMDTYDNLTLKTIMAFRWVTEFCPNARFVMKTDSDVFINTGNLVKFLLKLNSSESIFTGYPFIGSFAYRGFYKKTYISYDEYPFSFYPPYCSGMGYILDGNLALRVYEMMNHIRPIKFEDVYVGICLNILKVNIFIPEEERFFLYKINFDICKYRHLIAVHGIKPSEMIQFWQDLSSNTSVTCL